MILNIEIDIDASISMTVLSACIEIGQNIKKGATSRITVLMKNTIYEIFLLMSCSDYQRSDNATTSTIIFIKLS